MKFTNEETQLLMEDGYKPGYMGDIREGDLVAIPPVSRTSFAGEIHPVKTIVVDRLMKQDASYFDPDENEQVQNVVINFIGFNLDNLPEHLSYGSMYPCFYKREEEQKAIGPGTES
jgi:hypothetical protein